MLASDHLVQILSNAGVPCNQLREVAQEITVLFAVTTFRKRIDDDELRDMHVSKPDTDFGWFRPSPPNRTYPRRQQWIDTGSGPGF